MNRRILALATSAIAATATVAGVAASAGAATAAPQPCKITDVSYYFGGFTEGLGQVDYDITLLAHDGTDCTLPDKPKITLDVPRGQKRKVKLHVNGRGGTLELTPDTPLHATVYYTVPDTKRDTVSVSGLNLAMPRGRKSATYFGVPGTVKLAAVNGILVSAWTTGIGLGQGEQSF